MNAPPVFAADHFHRGTRLLQEGKAAEAEQAFRQALALDPDLPEAHVNLGWLMEARQRLQEAETHYRRALELDPLRPQTRLNLGTLLLGRKQLAEAELHFRYAAALDPRSPAPLANLAVALSHMGREDEAERCYRAVLEKEPGDRRTQFNLAYLLLRQGRYEEGWARLEVRDANARFARTFSFPRWRGDALDGRSLLIAYEAGYGDMIQFCRYASLLKQRGAGRIGLVCHPPLKRLFARLRDVDEVFDFGVSLPVAGWDCWTLPLSLPFLCRTRLDTIPADIPYLSAEPEQTARWARRLGPGDDALRIGLAWRGDPQHPNDADRSLPSLATLAPLAELPGTRFFSLQKGHAERLASAPERPFAIENLAPHIDDFADTAAALAHLDLVITVDTSLAHLAGAMGKPCWVMLPHHMTDCRWLAQRDDTPWYPQGMRLFRQKIAGDWRAPVAEMREALRAFEAARHVR